MHTVRRDGQAADALQDLQRRRARAADGVDAGSRTGGRRKWRAGRPVRGNSGGRAAADGRARAQFDEGVGERRAGGSAEGFVQQGRSVMSAGNGTTVMSEKSSYVLRTGALAWGVPMFILAN